MIPFVDLRAQYQSIKSEIDAAVLGVLESGHYVLGPEVAAFEREFADAIGVRHAVAVNSGTSALHLSLLALGIGRGDEVVTVAMTFVATAAAIAYTGATPVLVDVDPVRYTMDPERLEAALTPRTKAIMPVHLYGQLADMDAILDVASRHGIPVIEDAAQAHLASDAQGQCAGSRGVAAAFSFYPGKNLGACGEGGLLVTNDAAIDRQARVLRDWGQTRRYEHAVLGYNYRMDGVQGAILRVKFRHLAAWTAARRAHASRYDQLLAGTSMTTPRPDADGTHVYHIYAARTVRRDEFRTHLDAAGVSTGIHYPVPVHLQPAFRDLGYRMGDFPVSERIGAEEVSLPMFAELTETQIETVAAAVRSFDHAAV
ncbi:MAG: DegT/DnrJ/EryC1/StrS family aminotransferase [Acidobacteria bacterium]|nr:DegT/DnrJ/EryC1/StrS family aminotransferase [Acidobacteriota bacterium]